MAAVLSNKTVFVICRSLPFDTDLSKVPSAPQIDQYGAIINMLIYKTGRNSDQTENPRR